MLLFHISVWVFNFLWQRLPSPVKKSMLRIRDVYPGFEFPDFLLIPDPDPQHYKKYCFFVLASGFSSFYERDYRVPLKNQCCGSEMFILDPNFSIPESGSESKNLSILTQKLFLSSRKYDPGCSSRIRILVVNPSRIPDHRKKYCFFVLASGFLSFCDRDYPIRSSK